MPGVGALYQLNGGTHISNSIAFSNPTGIVAAPDGNLYIGDNVGGGTIWEVSMRNGGGAIRSTSFATGTSPQGLAIGPEGNLWISTNGASVIDFPLLKTDGGRASQAGITKIAGSSGNLYWSMPEQGASYKKVVIDLAAVSMTSHVITFPTAFTHTPDIVAGLGAATAAAAGSVSTTQYTTGTVTSATGTILIEGF